MRERLEELLATILPGFDSLAGMDRLPQGASAETYEIRVNTDRGTHRLCLRRAPGGEESGERKPGIRTQARLIQLAAASGVPAPEILHVLEPSDGLGDGFLMNWVEGESLGSRIVRSEELAEIRPRLAFECGEVLARIHAIDLEAEKLARALHRTQASDEVEQTWDRYRQLETPQPMVDFTARWLLDRLPEPTGDKLVHAEFRNGNFIVTPGGIRAVLDWEMAHIGDPMRDLGWLCNNSWTYGKTELPVGGFGTLEQLFSGYESVTGEPVDRDRVYFWLVYGSFWWAITCLTMVDTFRTGPDRSIERAAIGRRSSEAQIDCVNLLIPGPATPPAQEPSASALDMPESEELLRAARDFLRGDVMSNTSGRVNFHARVAANAIDIVARDIEMGPAAREQESQELAALLGKDGELEDLRWDLVHALRSGSMPLDRPGLADHLRQTVVTQVAIDQPSYSGLRTAMRRTGA